MYYTVLELLLGRLKSDFVCFFPAGFLRETETFRSRTKCLHVIMDPHPPAPGCPVCLNDSHSQLEAGEWRIFCYVCSMSASRKAEAVLMRRDVLRSLFIFSESHGGGGGWGGAAWFLYRGFAAALYEQILHCRTSKTSCAVIRRLILCIPTFLSSPFLHLMSSDGTALIPRLSLLIFALKRESFRDYYLVSPVLGRNSWILSGYQCQARAGI